MLETGPRRGWPRPGVRWAVNSGTRVPVAPGRVSTGARPGRSQQSGDAPQPMPTPTGSSGASPPAPGTGPRPRQATVAGIVRRHWLATVPMLLLTILVVGLLESGRPVVYDASSSLLLASPEVDPGRFPDSESTLRTLAERLGGSSMDDELGWDSDDLQAVTVDERTLELIVRGPSTSETRERLADVSEWIGEILTSMQAAAGYAPADRIRMRVIAPDPVPVVDVAGVFEASALIRLEDAGPADANPYGSSASTLRLLQVTASSDRGQQRLRASVGDDAEVQVHVDPRDPAPVIHVTAYGLLPESTLNAVLAGQRFLEEEIEARQDRAEVPQSARVWLDPLSRPVEANRLTPLVATSSLLALAAGSVLAVGVAAAVDWRVRRRRPPPPRTAPTDAH